MSDPTPPAVSEAMREAVSRKLAELADWHPDCIYEPRQMPNVCLAIPGEPIWLAFCEDADAILAGPIASEIARLTERAERAETDADLRKMQVTNICRALGLTANVGAYARIDEMNARAEAAEAALSRLQADRDAELGRARKYEREEIVRFLIEEADNGHPYYAAAYRIRDRAALTETPDA